MISQESDKKKIRLTKQIQKKQRQIEDIREKRKHHQIDDHHFLSKKKRIENQIQSIKLKIDKMN